MQEMVKMMYMLVETEDTSGISSPLKTTNRIKFLTFAASENLIVFGASSGGLYVYNRESFTFKSLVPSKEGPVTCVKISPDEKWFGFSTSRGVSCVLEHNVSSVNRRILSQVHEGRKVTALEWNSSSSQLYIGDNTGQISVISVASYLTPAVALMQLDSAVVQIDTCSYMLLASTLTRSYLCDTFREQYRQIGTRMRDGHFGGCFYHVDSYESHLDSFQDSNLNQKDSPGPFSSSNDGEWLLEDKNLQNIKLYCARPGLRLWEVRIDGSVMSTHQYKQLRSTPPVSVIHPPGVGVSSQAEEASQFKHLFQFTKLCEVSSKYLLTYDSNGLCVLDPMTSEVILWTDEFKNIVDVHVVGDIMYLWMGDSKLHAVYLTPVDRFLVRMYLQKRYFYCAQLCAAHFLTLKKVAHVSLKMHILVDLVKKLKEGNLESTLDEEVLKKINELMEEISRSTENQEHAQMLKSGIFIVGNAHLLSQKETFSLPKPLNHIPNNLAVKGVEDIFPNASRNHNLRFQEKDQIEGEIANNILTNSILPSISSLPQTGEPSYVNNDEEFDPFPDLPLSSLTSTETIMALKNLTSSVSGTISNGTKSLKEKWHTFEERLRRPEENGLSVEKSINRHGIETSNSPENDDNGSSMYSSSQKRTINLPIASFIEKCNLVTCYDSENGKFDQSLQEIQFEMLDSFAVLYGKFRQSYRVGSGKTAISYSEEQEAPSYLPKWLSSKDVVPFPFFDHFTKEFVVLLSHLFHVCLKLGSLAKWLEPFLSNTELDYSLFPSHVGRIHSKTSLLLDQALGRFLKICCGLLDPYSALESLEESGVPCHYFAWNVIVDHFQTTSSVGPSIALDKDDSQWPLPRTVNAMLVLLQLGQMESCRNLGVPVPIKHVLRMALKLKEDPLQISKLFLSYLGKVPMEELQRKMEDPEVYFYTRHAFESLHKAEPDSLCYCGFPVKAVKFESSFRHVGQALLSHIYQTLGLSEAMSFCQRTSLLWCHLLVLRRSEATEEIIPLILHVGSEEELQNRCSDFSVPHWDLLFQLRAKLEQGYCLHCKAKLPVVPSNFLPWMSLASLLLRKTSVDMALSLLSKFSLSIPKGSISLQFYRSCLIASVAESQSEQLKEDLLGALADSETLPVLAPKLSDRLDLSHSQSQHHWGLHLQLSKNHCLCCLLPLGSSPGGSIIGFQCSHSFHSICLEQRLLKQCPICIKS